MDKNTMIQNLARELNEKDGFNGAWLYAEKGERIASDIIKMPHHGYNRPSYDAFKAIHPQVGIITNHYSERIHPVYQFMCNHRCFPMYTGSGIIQAATDGKTWQVTQYLIW